MRNSAYRSAYAKADEASKSLRLEQTPQTKEEEEESLVFADDDEDLYKALERTRKLALKKQEAEASGPQAIALLATSTLCSQIADDQNPDIGESLEKNLSSLRWKSLSQLSILLKVLFLLYVLLFYKILHKKERVLMGRKLVLHSDC
jgi:hypothetical protein